MQNKKIFFVILILVIFFAVLLGAYYYNQSFMNKKEIIPEEKEIEKVVGREKLNPIHDGALFIKITSIFTKENDPNEILANVNLALNFENSSENEIEKRFLIREDALFTEGVRGPDASIKEIEFASLNVGDELRVAVLESVEEIIERSLFSIVRGKRIIPEEE